jgi:putative oxidoreductase
MTEDLGKLILRLTVGVLMLLHGLAKMTGGVSGIGGALQGVGLPAELAYGAYIGEVLAPLLIIFGFYARVGAVLMAINMLFAIGLAHMKDLFVLAEGGGWALELQAFFLACSVAVALIGPGRYAINRR